jgi:hypothetical protein
MVCPISLSSTWFGSDHLVKLCQTVSGNHSIQCSRLNPVSRPPVLSCHLLKWNSQNHLLHQSLHQSPVSLHPVDLAARIGHGHNHKNWSRAKGSANTSSLANLANANKANQKFKRKTNSWPSCRTCSYFELLQHQVRDSSNLGALISLMHAFPVYAEFMLPTATNSSSSPYRER